MSADRCCPAPAAAREPGFLRALELATMASLVQRSLGAGGVLQELHPDYVRWKDHDGSLLGYRATVRCGDEQLATYVTARAGPSHRLADEAERLRHRAGEDHAGLHAFALLPDADLLLLAFPLDRALPDLRRLVRASKLRGLVAQCCPDLLPAGLRLSKSRSHGRIVRYKPERRAVLHWDLGCVDAGAAERARRSLWVRCYAEPQAGRTAGAAAAAAAAGVPCPRALGRPHDRLLLESHLEGEPWRPSAAAVADAAAAAAVARLHGARPPAGLPFHGPLAELDLVLRAAEDLDRLDPALGALAARVGDRLAHAVPPASAPGLAHGDLHPGQVLIAGECAGLCDFDRACVAPPALDLAAFTAHCVATDPVAGAELARRFRGDYARHRPLPAPAELAWWTTAALVRAATTPFRALCADWPTAARSLLAAAARELGAGLGASP